MRFSNKQYLRALYPSLHAKYAIFILLLVLFSYWNILSNGFTFDDHLLIESNPNITSIKNIYSIAFEPVKVQDIQSSPETTIRGLMYRPVSYIMFYLIGKFFSVTPFSFHLFNLIFHCLNSVLIYLMCIRLSFSSKSALFTAAIFAVHPVHTESVASAMSMPEEYMFFFGIMSFLFITSNIKWNYVIASVMFLAALLAKENAVIFIFVYIGLIAYLHITSHLEHKRYLPKIAAVLLVPLIIYFAMRYHVTGALLRGPAGSQLSLDNPLLQAPFTIRMLTSIYIIWKYLALCLCPVNLSADYSFGSIAPVSSASDPRFIFSVITLVIVLILFIFSGIKKRWPEMLGLYIFFISLLPVSNILFVGSAMMAERYLYLPSLGVCIILGYLAGACADSQKKYLSVAAYATVLLLIVIMIGLSMTRNKAWKDDAALFSSVLHVYPHNLKALNNLAAVHFRNGEYARAIPLYEQVIKMNPKHYLGHLRIVLSYYNLKQINNAIQTCQKAVKNFPRSDELYEILAELYEKTGNNKQALLTLKEGIIYIPDSYVLYFRIGEYFFINNDCKSAQDYFMNSLSIHDASNPHYYLAKCYYIQGKAKDALVEFSKSLGALQQHPDIMKYIVRINVENDSYAKAEKAAMDYIREFPQNAEAYASAAELYWRANNDFQLAHQYMQKALSLDSSLCAKNEYMKLCLTLGF